MGGTRICFIRPVNILHCSEEGLPRVNGSICRRHGEVLHG